MDGKKWIYMRQIKTNKILRIPLLDEAEVILEKYKDDSRVDYSDIYFPFIPTRKPISN